MKCWISRSVLLGSLVLGGSVTAMPQAAVAEPLAAEPVASKTTNAIALAQAEEWFEQGQVSYEAGEFETALNQYSEAIALNATHVKAYASRASVLGILEDYEGAIADYTTAIGLEPDFAVAYGGRGYAQALKGDLTAASEDLWEAAQLFKGQEDMDNYLKILALLGQLAP